jgi:hypothetical protein
MDDPIRKCVEYNRAYFSYIEEFFFRTTGKIATDFASIDTFSERVKIDPRAVALRAADSYPWLDSEFRTFVAKRGVEAFGNATSLGGTNLVLGGSSRFLGSQLDSTLAMVLYSDTVFIPDPIMPWLEKKRSEERFQHVQLLQAAHTLLHLKPLVDADLPIPPVFVFPSWEKVLEDTDPQTQDGILQLVTDVLSNCLGENLASIDEILAYSRTNEEGLYRAVDQNHLFVAPGGPVDEPLREALARYDKEMRTWRSDEWIDQYDRWPIAGKIINGVFERLSPIPFTAALISGSVA